MKKFGIRLKDNTVVTATHLRKEEFMALTPVAQAAHTDAVKADGAKVAGQVIELYAVECNRTNAGGYAFLMEDPNQIAADRAVLTVTEKQFSRYADNFGVLPETLRFIINGTPDNGLRVTYTPTIAGEMYDGENGPQRAESSFLRSSVEGLLLSPAAKAKLNALMEQFIMAAEVANRTNKVAAAPVVTETPPARRRYVDLTAAGTPDPTPEQIEAAAKAAEEARLLAEKALIETEKNGKKS